MALHLEDESHLRLALRMAEGARAFASPNPTVGCVIVQEGRIVGQGEHHYEARAHAEVVALRQAGGQARGATAYVTLEPCSHTGRTGPCADALLHAGIARCVIATIDPNPVVRGRGMARLRAGGVEVELAQGEPAEAARRLNDAFACFVQTGRPFVVLKAALSVDGRLAPPAAARTAGQPHWVTGEAARASAQPLRHRVDAILTGIGTVLADDPLLTDRTGQPRRRGLLRVVLDSRLRLPLHSRLLQAVAEDLLLVCSDDAPPAAEHALLARGAQVLRMPVGSGLLQPQAVLQELAARACTSVLVEAGSAINGSMLRAALVDELWLYYSEQEFGSAGLPFAAGYESPYSLQQRLSGLTRTSFPADPQGRAEDVLLRGYLRDPWATVAG